jgi:hypothetical protein
MLSNLQRDQYECKGLEDNPCLKQALLCSCGCVTMLVNVTALLRALTMWFTHNSLAVPLFPGLEGREYGCGDPLCGPRDTLHPQKLALTSPTSSGHSVSIVRSRNFFVFFSLFQDNWKSKLLTNNYIYRLNTYSNHASSITGSQWIFAPVTAINRDN